jgi:Fuc2NAc and GlcNAc transferase
LIYIVLLFVSFGLTYLIKNYAIKKSLVDIPNDRSSHHVATPHGGGVAIAITWFLGLSYLYYVDDISSQLYMALAVGLVIAIVSYIDDLIELSPKLRLSAQACVAFMGLYFLGGFQELNFFFFTIENQIFTNIFAFFMIIWFINLYNFLDGINGYGGGEAIFLGLAGFLLFGGSHFIVLVVAVLGFLVWNWGNAKIFMGDVGSTLLGYNVAIFTLYYANQDANDFWVWIILFGVFWFDATFTLVKRALSHEKLSQAHKKHVYQRLTQGGWSHVRVSSWMLVLNALLFLIVYFVSNLFVAFILAMVLLFGVVWFVDARKSF